MTEREAIHKLILFRRILEKGVFPVGYRFDAEPFDLAISALEKQEIDKCCETCKYECLELDAYPCSDCIRAKDHYEPYTEEEA